MREPFERMSFTTIRCGICGRVNNGASFFAAPTPEIRCPTCSAIDERSFGARLYNFIISRAWGDNDVRGVGNDNKGDTNGCSRKDKR